MESWRTVWRKGVAPGLPTAGLKALEKAIEEDDKTLLQGATTSPPPLLCVEEWPVEGACPIGYSFWKDGTGKATVAQVEAEFAKICYDCDTRLGEPASCRWLLDFWDESPRAEAFAALLPEVKMELARREKSPE